MKSRLLLALALFGMCSSESSAQIHSQNIVGYHTVETCPDGYFIIANSFINGGNELNRILPMPDWADGTSILKWDPATQSYRDTIQWATGYGWYSPSDPDPTLYPSEGAFIQTVSNSVFRSVPITFVGEVPIGRLCQPLPGNNSYTIWAPPLGRTVSMFSPQDGDSVHFYRCGPPPFWSIYQYLDGFGWFNPDDFFVQPPDFPPGVAAFIQLVGSSRNTCSPCLTCFDAENGSAASEPGVLLSNPQKDGTHFTFSFGSKVRVAYQPQSAVDGPSGPWSNLGPAITGDGASIPVADTEATTPLKLYRVIQPQ